MLLLDDGHFVLGASPETVINQQEMQISECRHGHTRFAEFHPRAGDGIQHPFRDHRDHPWSRFKMNKTARGPLLAIVPADPAPMERMPAVMDDDFLSDMGRMARH